MSLRWRLLVSFVVIVATIAAITIYFQWQTLERQWKSFRVGTAESYQVARTRLAWFHEGPHSLERIRELVESWGTGNPRFDLYLAHYVRDPQSTEDLRQALSLELAWRDGLLARWARYWSWRSTLEPDQQIASLVDYFRLLDRDDSSRPITWREVLDLQAVFELSGQGRLALRLSPENWRERFNTWQAARPRQLPHVARPSSPFEDWLGEPPS